ncbi:hypothetical protein J7E87_21045 [Streptomyces sp. ISL-1]|uniref:hypothetical protein n=1 Tax=Streptomyces sp. ISL-1 TaxID=2817657 RepID=UPI001BEBB112|nr:hypothetical protein [Streptomyces sp. ISL-1]MBT2391850.1 hypothetical protein [Streptomyces sp. ISL-1]
MNGAVSRPRLIGLLKHGPDPNVLQPLCCSGSMLKTEDGQARIAELAFLLRMLHQVEDGHSRG